MIPTFQELYAENLKSDNMEIIRWKLLAWIMLLTDHAVTAIKAIPKQYRLICAILYVLVTVGMQLISK